MDLKKGDTGWEEFRHCKRKARYVDRPHHGVALRSYRCRFCEGWHLTHKPRSGRQRLDMNQMTPKQQYEARKAERQKLKDLDYQVRQATEQLMMMDMMDRFVTAAERIADALEKPQVQTSNLVFDPNSASGFKVAI